MFHIGLDLAWADPTDKRPNESGLVMLDPAGEVVHAGWTVGVAATVDWIGPHPATRLRACECSCPGWGQAVANLLWHCAAHASQGPHAP